MSTILEPATQPELRRALVVPLTAEWRDSGNPDTPYETTLRGHAAVFNSLSHDLGGFREILAPGAFRSALRKQPDVRLLLNHDGNYVMARTASGTLELREDGNGLHVFARVDRRISWVEDLRTSMQRGDVDQMSFAFTIADGGDDWSVTEDGQVVRSIKPDGVDGLFDVSVVTYPAYEATRVNMRGALEAAIAAGKIPARTTGGATIQLAGDFVIPSGPTVDEMIQGLNEHRANAGAETESRKGSGVHIARAAALRLRAANTPKL